MRYPKIGLEVNLGGGEGRGGWDYMALGQREGAKV